MTGLLLPGITYVDSCSKWRARAGTGEYRYHVGRYDTEEEAAAALRAEQEQERRRRGELEDPIDRICEHFPNDVAQAQRLQKKLAEHLRHLLLRPAEIHGVLHVAPRPPTTLATSPCAYPPRTAFGVYFDVRSNGPAVALTALSGGGHCGDAAVVIYACEGSGVGRETERGAWRVVGAGTLKYCYTTLYMDSTRLAMNRTRLALCAPVVVAAGATVGLFVHSAKRDSNGVQMSKEGKLGGSPGEEVDASDRAISVLKGGTCVEKNPFVSVRTDGCYADGTGGCYALAGSVEYEMAQCKPSDRTTTVCGEVMRALCEGPEGEPRWAADVRLGDSVRIVRKTTQAPQPPRE